MHWFDQRASIASPKPTAKMLASATLARLRLTFWFSLMSCSAQTAPHYCISPAFPIPHLLLLSEMGKFFRASLGQRQQQCHWRHGEVVPPLRNGDDLSRPARCAGLGSSGKKAGSQGLLRAPRPGALKNLRLTTTAALFLHVHPGLYLHHLDNLGSRIDASHSFSLASRVPHTTC